MINYISKYASIYCLDMPGFGDSDEPYKNLNLDDYVDFIIKFIEKQNIKNLSIIGHSNGGRIAIKLLNKENLNFTVDKLLLIGSAGIVHKKNLFNRTKLNLFKLGKKILEIKIIKKFFPNILNKLKNIFGSEDYKNSSPVMKNTLVNLVNEDLTKYLINISIPTLLIWGENDTETPISDGEIMENLISNSKLIKIKKCSHYVFLEHPDYTNKIIKSFLNGGKR